MPIVNYGNINAAGNRDPTARLDVFLANKHNMAQITHAFVDDGGVFGENLIYADYSSPVSLLPASPATNDAVYFGIDSTLPDSGPFTSVIFDIATPAVYTGAATLAWEFWTGAWTPLLFYEGLGDNTNNGLGTFTKCGVNVVNTAYALDSTLWLSTGNVNGIVGYWIRALVTLTGGTISPPTQQNRRFYSVTSPYIEIQADQISGDIDAAGSIILKGGSESGTTVIGRRSVERGEDFTSHLNISDTQNNSSLSIQLGVSTTFENNITHAPSGRRANYTSVAADTIADRVTFLFGSQLARQYGGTYRALLYHTNLQNNGTSFTARLRKRFGTGGSDYYTETVPLSNVTVNPGTFGHYVTDLGRLTIPPDATKFDQIFLAIQIGHSAASVQTIHMYQLVLIPIDEWAVEIVSIQDGVGIIGKIVTIDSIREPKDTRFCAVLDSVDGRVSRHLIPRTSFDVSFAPNERQRLWFTHYSAPRQPGVPSAGWSPYTVYCAGVKKQDRYFSMRGDR